MENIEEGNKIISEFMGYQILRKKYQTQHYCSSNESTWVVDEGDIVCDDNGNEVDDERQEPYFELEFLPFNSSWDWLMPVWKKITNTCPPFNKNNQSDGYFAYNSVPIFLEDVNIEKTWYYIVKYINWYNNNKV
jgi:hypothetical protein